MSGKKRPGPNPDHLKIERDDWKDAVREALEKKRPPGGWPKDVKKKPKKRRGKE
jgi:hypothetical protein